MDPSGKKHFCSGCGAAIEVGSPVFVTLRSFSFFLVDSAGETKFYWPRTRKRDDYVATVVEHCLSCVEKDASLLRHVEELDFTDCHAEADRTSKECKVWDRLFPEYKQRNDFLLRVLDAVTKLTKRNGALT